MRGRERGGRKERGLRRGREGITRKNVQNVNTDRDKRGGGGEGKRRILDKRKCGGMKEGKKDMKL